MAWWKMALLFAAGVITGGAAWALGEIGFDHQEGQSHEAARESEVLGDVHGTQHQEIRPESKAHETRDQDQQRL